MITINWTLIGLNWTISLKCLEMTFAVIWRDINKLNLIELTSMVVQRFYRLNSVVVGSDQLCDITEESEPAGSQGHIASKTS